MPIATPSQYADMLNAAQEGNYAYPAINVSSLVNLNGALKAFADKKSDGIIQVSTGAGEFASGLNVKDMVLGAIVLAEVFLVALAGRYLMHVRYDYDAQKAKLDARSAIYTEAKDPQVIVDENGCILDWNAAAEAELGWDASEVVGQSADFLVPDDARDDFKELLQNRAVQSQAERRPQQFDERVPRKDQSPLDAKINVRGVRVKDRGMNYLITVKPAEDEAVKAASGAKASTTEDPAK